MVYRCIVDNCTTTFSSRGRKCKPEGVKLHRFPKPYDRLFAWVRNIRTVNGPEWLPPNTENTRICSLHFTPQSYELERQDGVVKLKPNAVPTIFRTPSTTTPPPRSSTTITSDHLYSVAREEAEKNSRRKVLENIMNSRNTDHVYASPFEPPICKIQSTQSVVCGAPSTTENSTTEDSAPLQIPEKETTDDCEIIEPDEDRPDSVVEIESEDETSSVLDTSKMQFKTCLINGLLHIELPDGSLAQIVAGNALTNQSSRNSFTDSEVDKIQIKNLSDENRKLQEELTRVRSYAEKLIRQNQRLKQQNRVTARAYRQLKKLVERSNENLSKRLNEDQIRALSKNSTRGQKWSDETLQEALALRAKCGTAVYKEISQRLPYPSVRKLQEAVQMQRFDLEDKHDNELLDLIATDLHSDLPSEENPQDTTISGESFSMDEIVNT